MFFKTGNILGPILLHYLTANLIYLLFGNKLDAAQLTVLTAIFVLPLVSFCYIRKQKREERAAIPWWSYAVAGGLGIVTNQGLTWMMTYFAVTEKFSNAVQEELLRTDFLIQLLGLGILVPITEEVLFRGLVYQRLKKDTKKWLAVLLGAGLFAVYHGNAMQMIFAFPMAVVLILLYEKWESLWIPIVFHIAGNLSAVILNRG